jgi:hypothetical protein
MHDKNGNVVVFTKQAIYTLGDHDVVAEVDSYAKVPNTPTLLYDLQPPGTTLRYMGDVAACYVMPGGEVYRGLPWPGTEPEPCYVEYRFRILPTGE